MNDFFFFHPDSIRTKFRIVIIFGPNPDIAKLSNS